MKHINAKHILLVSLLAFLTASLPSFSQLDKPLQRFNFHETVWLTTDRHLYVPGENIRFSAILFETDTYLPSALSKIIRIELFNSEGKQISRHKFELGEGKVSQEINLPITLTTGWYYLRVYTNWMRNYHSMNNCILPIKVVKAEDIENYIYKDVTGSLKVEITPENRSADLTSLASYSVHTTGINGEPVAVSGHLMNGADTTASFKTDLSGWTMVEATGINAGTRITADLYKSDSIRLIFKSRDSALPVLNMTESTGKVTIKASAGKETDISELKLLVHSTGTIYWSEKRAGQSESVEFIVPSSSLPQGIAQFSLLDQNNRVLDKRLWISKNIIASTPELDVSKVNTGYRDTNEVKLFISEVALKSSGNIQLLAAREEPFNPLTTFLPGLPGWPSGYEIPSNNKAREAWLIASSYPDDVINGFAIDEKGDLVNPVYSRELIINDIESSLIYVPETRGATVNGSVLNTSLSEGVQNIDVGLTVLNDNTFLAEKTFGTGRFHFVVPESTETMDMLLAFIEKPADDYVIRIDPEYETTPPSLTSPPFNLTDKEVLFIRQLNIDMQIKSIYGKEESVIKAPPKSAIDKPAFFGTPDRTVTIDKYIKLPNISELIFELIPNVSVRRVGEKFLINVYGETELPVLYKPAILLDGIPIYDFNEFLELPPDRLSMVEVKNKLYIHGNTLFSGAVSFHSVNKDLAGLGLPKKSQLLTVEKAAGNREKSFIIDPSIPENIPQLDNTLLWEFVIGKPTASISFSTNDNYGNFNMMVFGYNSSGQWVFNTIPFKVGLAK